MCWRRTTTRISIGVGPRPTGGSSDVQTTPQTVIIHLIGKLPRCRLIIKQ